MRQVWGSRVGVGVCESLGVVRGEYKCPSPQNSIEMRVLLPSFVPHSWGNSSSPPPTRRSVGGLSWLGKAPDGRRDAMQELVQ